MPAKSHTDKGPLSKLLLSSALVVISAAYGYWQKKPAMPQAVSAPDAPAPLREVQMAASDPGSGIGGYVFHEGPPAAAIPMPKGSHVEDGEYTSQEWESGFGTVQVKVRIKAGRFTHLDYLLVPDERQRSEEISRMAKPLLIHEMIHDQKADVNIITTATYTSFAFMDALTDVVQQATRPRPAKTGEMTGHDLAPLYIGGQ